MRVLDLFSGIGGFSLGLERAGFHTVAFCEIEPYCRAVLKHHWPEVPCYDDIRTLTADRLAADGIGIDVICGGFPCQDISAAGKGAGLAGERSGLWREFYRLIREIRPRYVIVENVSALLSRGLGTILGDLSSIGYDAEWHCIPAAYVGAPHRRDRVWIVAHPEGLGRFQEFGISQHADLEGPPWDLIDGCGAGRCGNRTYVSDPSGERLPQPERVAVLGTGRRDEGRAAPECGWWEFEPDVGRVAHGVPKRVDRLKALGNAVVPQVVEMIGRAILALWTWMLSSSSDRRALNVVDGTGPHEGRGPHYSRRTPGSKTFTGVGREIVLVTADGNAVWACVYQRTPAARGTGVSRGRTATHDIKPRYIWRNMMFRNLGTSLSSDLIRWATARTYEEWCYRYGAIPAERLRTEIDIGRVASPNPGYCYLCAGWERDRIVRGKLYLFAPPVTSLT